MKNVIFVIILFFLVTAATPRVWAAEYYVSKSGNNSNPGTEAQPWKTIQKAANTLTAGDTVYIKAGTYNERVVPKNSGNAGNYITYTNYNNDTVTIDGTGVSIPPAWGGLLEISEVSYIKVSGLTIRDAGPDDNHNGILLEDSSYIIIENNHTYNTASSGIGVWDCSNIIIDNNEVELACNDGEQECISVGGTDTFEIRNNHVHHSGPGSIGGEGICLKDGSSNGKAYNNHVHHLNRLGIYMDAWDKHTYNIEVYGNVVHDIDGNDCFTFASEAGGLLENITVYNNIGYNADTLGLTVSINGYPNISHPMKNITIINNTFYNNGGGGWGGGIAVENPNAQNVVIRNNIVSQNVTFQIEVEPNVSMSKLTIDHNLIHGYRGYGDEVRGTDYVEGNPLFVNASSADFHIQENSPAVDAGSSSGAPSDDYEGNGRPQGSGYDIGAYEYVPAAANPEISLSRTEIDVEAGLGSTTLLTETFTISNSGEGTLDWSVSDDAAWMSVNPTSGTGSGQVTVTVDPSGLSIGSYTGTITVSSSNASNSPQTVTVDLTITSGSGGQISLSRTAINFAALSGSTTTMAETFTISGSGTGVLVWNVSDNAAWLSTSPTSGTGTGVVTVTVDPSGLSTGSYIGTVTVSASNASNSPQTLTVNLTVKSASEDQPPFGQFETPVHGSTVRSSIPVTGWALDDVSVVSVKIYRAPVPGEGGSRVYIGDALLVEGARPDIESAYPTYPYNYKAGWGYMMLTNFLPNQGNGTFTLYAAATDNSGHEVTLGTKTITCDNANAVKPFGAIDTPVPGGIASGTTYRNQGWVLTPMPNSIPTNGSTINVYVDGVNLGHPVYNIYRPDIASLFPGYANSNGAHAYFDIDPPAFTNGVHTIAWTAEDNAGNSDGIGSRYFTVQNVLPPAARGALLKNCPPGPPAKLFIYTRPVGVIKGYKVAVEPQTIYPDYNGNIMIEIKELQRIEIHFSNSTLNISPLPIGSTLDTEKGIFYWQAGPGFLGKYTFGFITREKNGEYNKKVTINISPKWQK
jgi:parallel beta-helix repeat protein